MNLYSHPLAPQFESQAHLLIQIEDFVISAIKGGALMSNHYRPASAVLEMDEADRFERMIRRFLMVYQPGYRYSEHIAAFWNACVALGLLDPDCDGLSMPELYFPRWQGMDSVRHLVALLQAEARSEAFRRAGHDRTYALRQRTLVIEDYARSLIARHCKLLVVRVDLGYLAQAQHQVTIDDVYAHLGVLNRQRYLDPVFEHLVGAIWCLEQGRTRGYHLHLTYFFNGSLLQNGWHKGQAIGALWQQITGGIGWVHNCHGDEFKYPRRGIGKIHRSVPEECENLLKALTYFGEFDKEPQFLRMRPEGRRVYRTGLVPGLDCGREPRFLGGFGDDEHACA